MSEQPPKIYGAIAKVMAEVGAVGKNGRNEHQRYKFRAAEDVVAALQQVMARNGLVVVPKVVRCERRDVPTKNGGMSTATLIEVDHHFCSAEDGSEVVCTTIGEALDTSDKSANKSMTAALKYALTMTFMIPTELPDSEEDHHEPQQDDQRRGPPFHGQDPRDERPAGPPAQQQRQAPPAAAKDPLTNLTMEELAAEIGTAEVLSDIEKLAKVVVKGHKLRDALVKRHHEIAAKGKAA